MDAITKGHKMAKKRKWWEIALICIVGFCVVPSLLLFGVCAVGNNDLKQTHIEWEQRLSSLVEDKASVEEVRQFFLDAGKEPLDIDADEEVERVHEIVVFSERKPLWPMFMGSLILSVQFDEDGKATSYEVDEAYGFP